MKIIPLAMAGAYRIETEPVRDTRGHFARLWCRETFAAAGLDIAIEQTSASFNHRAGTLRGMHFIWPPGQEGKLVRCARGQMLDVLLDLRPEEPTFLTHVAVELNADAYAAVFIPPGVAHGFQTLVDATEVHYMMSENYRPELSAGVRYSDPAFKLQWPLPVSCVAHKDRDYPDFDQSAHCARYQAALEERA